MRNDQAGMNGARRRAGLVLAVVLVGSAVVATPPASAAPTTFTVTTTSDCGEGSLREAIALANANQPTGTDLNAGDDKIVFDLEGTGPFFIFVGECDGLALPEADPAGGRLEIEGGPGGEPSSEPPVVVLDGSCVNVCGDVDNFAAAATPGQNGIVLGAPLSVVSNLSIVNFPGAGVWLGPDATQSVVRYSWIGVEPPGRPQPGFAAAAVIPFEVGPNGVGVEIEAMQGTVVNSVVSGNLAEGVLVDGHFVSVSGSLIGVDPDGAAAVPNRIGIRTLDVTGANIASNVVSSNSHLNIKLREGAGHEIVANRIGLNLAGDGEPTGTVENDGGLLVRSDNVDILFNGISGNGAYGIRVEQPFISGPPSVQIKANLIGTDFAPVAGEAVPNHGPGIEILAPGVVVGGRDFGEDGEFAGNVIAYNEGAGVDVAGGPVIIGTEPVFDTEFTAAAEYGGDGGGYQEFPGGYGGIVGEGGNLIEENDGAGVLVRDLEGFPRGVRINGNSIDDNGGLGIDLMEGGADGVTENDPGDGDVGPNLLLNFPEVVGTVGTSYTLEWELDSVPNSEFWLEVFTGPECDPSGFGEGRHLVDSFFAATDGVGAASGERVFDIPPGDVVVTMTATDEDGNTSEFSNCVDTAVEPPPPPPPSGEIVLGTMVARARDITSACPPGQVPDRNFPDVVPTNTHRAAINCLAWWQITIGKLVDLPNGTAQAAALVLGYSPGSPITRGQLASMLARLIRRTGGTLPANPPDAFPDDGHTPHEANINALAAAGIITGFADGTYQPDSAITRDQMATLVAKTYQHRAGKALPVPGDFFTDDAGNVHEAAINALAGAGIVEGIGNQLFNPAAELRRDQMASFLVRLLDLLVDEGHSGPPPGA